MPSKAIPLNDRIIFALDVDSKEKAEKWLDVLGDHVHFYKVGLQLFIAGWFPVIDMITQRGHKVMVDLKIFDVPETVKLAVNQLKGHNITFVTIHGNDPIIREAVKHKNGMKLLAVTVLTSFCEDDMREMGLTRSIEDLVYIRAKKALELGCDGIVSSGLEAQRLRNHLGENFLIITPGIRPGSNTEAFIDDQKRIVTATEAFKNGADYIVVGRPISTAKDPIAIVNQMKEDIAHVL
ncbi:MAG: orotidine-5'-phosphate decarboxylase [Desulfobacterales bacterium]|nr:orotidine-5'-phosphate decarboxylase [Desulfobacterales bacterium]